MLCPVVVGRADEMDLLVGALDDAVAGRGSLAVLLGEAGIGKSRLARELVSHAQSRGARVLRGRAVQGSAAVAFRPLAEALAPVADELLAAGALLEPWLPALAGIAPGIGDQRRSPADDSPAARGEAVLRALQAVCGNGGLLVLEDLHWADPETLAVVDQLTDNLERASVLCLVTVRSEEPSSGRDLARAIADRRAGVVLKLPRLNDAQVSAMVHECTGGRPRADLERIISVAEGVPFLVEELLASPGVPTSFAETVQRRLEELDDEGRDVLTMSATLGRHFDWHLLSAATGMPQPAVVDALERATAAQLLAVDGDGFRFRHALTREAVLDTVLPPRRAAMATAALAAFDGAHANLGGSLREVAAALAERAEQPERAGALQLAGGLDALEHGALGSAVVALRRARELLPDGDARDRAGEALVDALTHAGQVDNALATGQELIGRLPADRAASIHLRLARAAIVGARWELAGTELDSARELVGADATSPRHAELAVHDAELALGVGDPVTAIDRARTALAAAGPAQPEVACAALLLIGRCERLSSLERAEAAFAASLTLAEANGLAVLRLRSLHELGTVRMLDRGDCALLLAARTLAEELGALATGAMLDVELCAGLEIVGDVEAARAHGLLAVERARELGLTGIVAAAWQLLATAGVMTHDHAFANEAAAAARAAAPGDTTIEGYLLQGHDSLHALVSEDRARAVTTAAAAMALLRQDPASAPSELRGLWTLLVALAHDDAASDAVDEVEHSGAGVNRLNLGYLAYARAVLAGRSDAASATALVAAGDRHLIHGPFWHQLGRRLVSEAALADGWGQPADWLQEAGRWFRDAGFDAVATTCASLVDNAQRPPHRWVSLGITRREADVLALIVAG
ncbi:MAG: hypothetical protein QOD72_2329, partial [Acidimicrobiaceae bacterium]|nr:hypothetical protein [Acidimicrobiaceae bacterium]